MNEAKTAKQQYWLNHIAAADESGLSLAQYAKTHNLKAQSLYQWRCSLKSQESTVTTSKQFTRVVTSIPDTTRRLTVRVHNTTLEFDALPDAHWLATLLRAVDATP